MQKRNLCPFKTVNILMFMSENTSFRREFRNANLFFKVKKVYFEIQQ